MFKFVSVLVKQRTVNDTCDLRPVFCTCPGYDVIGSSYIIYFEENVLGPIPERKCSARQQPQWIPVIYSKVRRRDIVLREESGTRQTSRDAVLLN